MTEKIREWENKVLYGGKAMTYYSHTYDYIKACMEDNIDEGNMFIYYRKYIPMAVSIDKFKKIFDNIIIQIKVEKMKEILK